MPSIALFGMSVAFSFIAWGLFAAHAVLPELRNRSRVDALRPLLILHSFRFLGLSFLIPGVVSPDLPAHFAFDAAYGDIICGVWRHYRRHSGHDIVGGVTRQSGRPAGLVLQRMGQH